MYFSMKQYTVACDDDAYGVNSAEEMARVDDLPDSSEEVWHAFNRAWWLELSNTEHENSTAISTL